MGGCLNVAFLQERLAGVDEVESAHSAVSCKACRRSMQLLGQRALVAEREPLMISQAQGGL